MHTHSKRKIGALSDPSESRDDIQKQIQFVKDWCSLTKNKWKKIVVNSTVGDVRKNGPYEPLCWILVFDE